MNFSKNIVEDIGKYYFKNSLRFFPESYLPIFLEPQDIITRHVAYLCPLCLEQAIMFINAPLQKVTGEFTEDHYPPKSVGGKNVILVCRLCNSKAGHDYDFTLQDHLRHLSFQKRVPGSTIPSQSIIPGAGIFKGKMIINNKCQVQVSLKNDEHHIIKPLDSWIKGSKKNLDWQIQLKFQTPHDEKVERALLHAAYLTCFENFGYEFIFSEAGQHMRNVFNGLERYAANVLDLNLDNETILNGIPIGMVFISYPAHLQSMAVTMKLTFKETGYTTIKVVLIPAPVSNGIDKIKSVSKSLVNHLGDISFVKLNNFLKMNEIPAYRKMWATLVRDYIQ